MARAKRFLIILIKPSHYDDNGYVIQWFRSPIPSNSLAARMRRRPAQNPHAAPAGNEDREPDRVLPAPGAGSAQFRVPLGAAFPQIPPRLEARQGRPDCEGLYRIERRGTERNGPHPG